MVQRIAGNLPVTRHYGGVFLEWLGEMLQDQFRPRTDQHRLLDDVLKLADVSRPRKGLQRRHGHRMDVKEFLAELVVEARRHSPHQRRNVLDALAYRRQMERHHVEAVIKVAAELAPFDRLVQVPIARDDDPSRAVLRFVASHRLVLAGLDDPQEVGLLFHPQRIDLVQEKRSIAGGGKLAHLGSIGPCERPLRVAKELAFHQIGGQRSAGHHQEAMVFSGRILVDEAGQVRLTGPGFARQQHRDIVGTGQGDAFHHRQQGRRPT